MIYTEVPDLNHFRLAEADNKHRHRKNDPKKSDIIKSNEKKKIEI